MRNVDQFLSSTSSLAIRLTSKNPIHTTEKARNYRHIEAIRKASRDILDNGRRCPPTCVGIGHSLAKKIFGVFDKIVIPPGYAYPKISLFKFMKSEDLHYLMEEESVQISGIHTYGDLPEVSGVGDPMEKNIGTITCEEIIPENPDHSLAIRNLAATGLMYVAPGTGGKITAEYRFTDWPNHHILCFSDRFSVEMMDRWKATPDANYDACIEITDAVKFIRCIQVADFYGERRFHRFSILDYVQYTETTRTWHNTDLTYFSFPKEEKFRWQEEIRISWAEELKDPKKPYRLIAPGISNLIRRVS